MMSSGGSFTRKMNDVGDAPAQRDEASTAATISSAPSPSGLLLADKLSSSLANIASAGLGVAPSPPTSGIPCPRRMGEHHTPFSADPPEEDALSSSSSTSTIKAQPGGAVMVTTTATTASSSGEGLGGSSSTSANASASAASSSNNLSSSGDDDADQRKPEAKEAMGTRNFAQGSTSDVATSQMLHAPQHHRIHHSHHHHTHHQPHHYRNHNHRPRKRPASQAATNSSSASGAPADEFGLPVPMDVNRLHAVAQNDNNAVPVVVAKHATVVAHHLPPPSTDSAASSGEGGSGGGADEAAAGCCGALTVSSSAISLLQRRREPGLNTIRRTFKKLVRKDTSKSSSTSGTETSNHRLPSKKKHHLSKEDPFLSGLTLKSSPPTSVDLKDTTPIQKKKRKRPHESCAPTSSARSGVEAGSESSSDDNAGTNGSSSGSGTEGGYAGSASSNDNVARAGTGSCSPPSVSSSSDNGVGKRKRSKVGAPNTAISTGATAGEATTVRPLLSKKQESSLSASSEIADFSSGASESEVAETMKALREDTSSESPSITSSSNGDGSSDEQDEAAAAAARSNSMRRSGMGGVQKRAERALMQASSEARKRHHARYHPPRSLQVPTSKHHQDHLKKQPRLGKVFMKDARPRGRLKIGDDCGPIIEGKPPILSVGCDIMAHVLTFLEPPAILQTLTMPLSKDWLHTFTRQPELWRVLCHVEPFKAPVDEDSSDESGDESFASFPMKASSAHYDFGKFRMMYTSFVRCMRYLERIKDDAQNGRPPSVIDFGTTNDSNSSLQHNIGANHSLQNFLARARGLVIANNGDNDQGQAAAEASGSLTDSSDDDNNNNGNGGDNSQDDDAAAAAAAAAPVVPDVAAVARLAPSHPIGVSDEDSSSHLPKKKRRRGREFTASGKKKVKYGRSMLTDRLLLPASGGETGHPELPWSCAVYSIVNWMVAFADVEGIQTMCLKVLPFLLEDEQQRITAQRAGLTDVVLRGMVMFQDSVTLHTNAFHTIVLLARPLGGREGMLFHTSMVNSSGIFSLGAGGSQNGRNGIAVMLDSMRRFQENELLQAMSCWSLVNIALVPAQKEVLVKLGGIATTANAMMAHPYNAEVQFRALFALINLVIPSVSLNPEPDEDEDVALPLEQHHQEQQQQQQRKVPEGDPEDSTERELLDESVEQIASLVVQAMKNFCSSEAILNRACLVLHNLSLTPEYHSVLLWTPNAYQMLEWCLTNYRTDQVLQQSAAGTLHRLQIYLSGDESLRARFAASIQAQQQHSLEQAHREAVILHQQHEQRLREEEQRRLQQPQRP